MTGRQKSLFQSELSGRQESDGLIRRPQPNRPLTKTQRTFNRLIARVEQLQFRLDRETQRLDKALAYYGEHLYPRLERLKALRKELVRAFAPFLDARRLKQQNQRRILRKIVAEQLNHVMEEEGSLKDDDLRAIFEQVHGVNFEQAELEEMEETRSAMEAMFDDLGIEVDLSDLRPDMSPEELAVKAAGIAESVRQKAEAEERADRPERRKTRHQPEKEAQMRQAEQLRKKSIATIYKQLARVLHPDLEPDPGRRQRKSVLMQELTSAYRNNDLHTLLRLELEWIHAEEGEVERLTEEKLTLYNLTLQEQVDALDRQLAELPYHPRYLSVAAPDGPFGIRFRTVGPAEAHRLDAAIAGMEASIGRMMAGQALVEVRSAIEAYRAALRSQYQPPAGRRRRYSEDDEDFF